MGHSSTNEPIDRAPVQDRDLLQRLSLYFDAIDHRLEQGQGWFIFNASQPRAHRISGFIQQRTVEHKPALRTYFVPWRDFALSAFVNEVGIAQIELEAEQRGSSSRMEKELTLAKNVTESAVGNMLGADLVVLTGIKPRARHEATFLDRVIEARYQQRQATILLTPDTPGALEDDFRQVDPSSVFWERVCTIACMKRASWRFSTCHAPIDRPSALTDREFCQDSRWSARSATSPRRSRVDSSGTT